MSTISILASWRHEVRDTFRVLLGTPKSWWAAFMTGRAHETAIAHLSAMSDRELKDIGLHRSQIVGAVRGTFQVGRYWN